jgi:hypothetical protein
MSGLLKGLQKFFTKDRVMILVIFILLAMFLLYYSTGKTTVFDSMDNGTMGSSSESSTSAPLMSIAQPSESGNVQSGGVVSDHRGYAVQQVANPSELLPNDVNSQWATLNPSSQNNPQTPDLLQAGIHIGLDTVGQTMKNPNLQLRSDPIIDKKDVGPWNMSTVEPDLLRQPLEVG